MYMLGGWKSGKLEAYKVLVYEIPIEDMMTKTIRPASVFQSACTGARRGSCR